MFQDKTSATELSNRMPKINRVLDEAVSFVQDWCTAEELEQFQLAVGEVM
ncbi:hypothetical protein [Paraburkholderia phenazinium]|jgi:hypothetical protein|uniref:Uncharacterized protein n=1 Tax=Paraburkholderia phenazinium TaxID=60549 RepID=A0A1N6FRA8_9BURK|nr:hypothetical protein [Paraburkholderia phenazinium]SIN97778.1 hypothetical protein SAMN05444165_0345 [Paraburkholderia phenazinium]